VTCIEDIPYDLMSAIEHANRIIDWQENLTGDEIPPTWMWHLSSELETHFGEVERRREEKYGSQNNGNGPMETVPMMSNSWERD